MLRVRPVDIQQERQDLLEFHCATTFSDESPIVVQQGYEQYRRRWLSTELPSSFLFEVEDSLTDPRTIAEVWLDDDEVAGYVWVTFSEIPGFNLSVAEVRDLSVWPAQRRKGIGSRMLTHVEELVRLRGADLLRAETSVDNQGAQALLRKFGIQPRHIAMEKVLSD